MATRRRRVTRGGSTRRNGGALSQFEPAIQRHIEGYIGSDPSWIQYRLGGHGGGIMNNIRSFLPRGYDPLEWGLNQRATNSSQRVRERLTAARNNDMYTDARLAQDIAFDEQEAAIANRQIAQLQGNVGRLRPRTGIHATDTQNRIDTARRIIDYRTNEVGRRREILRLRNRRREISNLAVAMTSMKQRRSIRRAREARAAAALAHRNG